MLAAVLSVPSLPRQGELLRQSGSGCPMFRDKPLILSVCAAEPSSRLPLGDFHSVGILGVEPLLSVRAPPMG